MDGLKFLREVGFSKEAILHKLRIVRERNWDEVLMVMINDVWMNVMDKVLFKKVFPSEKFRLHDAGFEVQTSNENKKKKSKKKKRNKKKEN